MAHNVCWDSHITWFLPTVVSTCILGLTCVLFLWGRCSLFGDLVMFVVDFFVLLLFSFQWIGGVPVHLQFVSVFALRLVLVL